MDPVPGRAATPGRGHHRHRHQCYVPGIDQGGCVTDAELCGAAATRPAVCVHTLIHLYLGHIHPQQRLQLRKERERKRERGREGRKECDEAS